MKDDFARKPVNWCELDRLVDGQLNCREYRELLRQIEKDPDGWRQCALAFLQHQALQQELGGGDLPDPATGVPASLAAGATGSDSEATALAGRLYRNFLVSVKLAGGIAAALMVGVTLGVIVRPVPPAGFDGTIDPPVNRIQNVSAGSQREIAGSASGPVTPATMRCSPRRASLRFGECVHRPVADEFYLGGHGNRPPSPDGSR